MLKNDNVKSVRLYESVKINISEEAAKSMADNLKILTNYAKTIQRVDEKVSGTWCLCTLGYTKKLFDSVFECDT